MVGPVLWQAVRVWERLLQHRCQKPYQRPRQTLWSCRCWPPTCRWCVRRRAMQQQRTPWRHLGCQQQQGGAVLWRGAASRTAAAPMAL